MNLNNGMSVNQTFLKISAILSYFRVTICQLVAVVSQWPKYKSRLIYMNFKRDNC